MISDDSGAFFASIEIGTCQPMYSGTLSVAASGSVSGNGYYNVHSPTCTPPSGPISFSGSYAPDVLTLAGATPGGTSVGQATWSYQSASSMPTMLSAFAGNWMASDGTAITVSASGQVSGDCTGQITNDDPDVDVFSITLATCADSGAGLATLFMPSPGSPFDAGSNPAIGVWTTQYLYFAQQ